MRILLSFAAFFLVPVFWGYVWEPDRRVCRDGWASSSIGKRGACSSHGGVDGSISLRGIVVMMTTLGATGGIFFYRELLNEIKPTPPPKITPQRPITPAPAPSPDYKPKSYRVAYRKRDKAGSNARICPKCNRGMVLRTAKKGANAGNKFLGCSNYPRCTGTRSV